MNTHLKLNIFYGRKSESMPQISNIILVELFCGKERYMSFMCHLCGHTKPMHDRILAAGDDPSDTDKIQWVIAQPLIVVATVLKNNCMVHT